MSASPVCIAILSLVIAVPVAAADQAESLHEIISAVQRVNDEMANPDLQRAVTEAVIAGGRSQSEEEAMQLKILD